MDNIKKPIECEDDPWDDLSIDSNELSRLMDNSFSENQNENSHTDQNCDGFDSTAGENWIYPKNLPERAYQFNIVHAALYHNTLVVLPTGLGKTFIAAVVMYNIYRWYPKSKVIFLAPTRPLVTQQIAACQSIMPFPSNETVELTGKLARTKRHNLWNSKRVFFATPQVVQSDVNNDSDVFQFPFKEVKLVVFDEAHKAKGNYAYTRLIEALRKHNNNFRVLALSATPGRTADDVSEVIRNLLISHLEIRFEGSIDVMPFTHKRSIKTIVVPLTEKIKSLRDELLEIIDPYVRQLVEMEVLNSSLVSINRNYLLYEQKRFRDRNSHHPQQTAINTNFSICISLYHALELLERHGIRVFLNNFEEDDEGRSKFVLTMDTKLQVLVNNLRNQLGANPFDVSTNKMTNGEIPKIPSNLDFGHPKFEEARKCLLEHFNNNKEARAIVFCEYRQSVLLMYRLLLQHAPLLRPRCFVGQGGTSGSIRAFTQKEQMKIMQDFRSGCSNILIATSVGEEGIDVGEVDFIVCFDINTSNPTRFVQRIGRTGRNKTGSVVMLVTEGREHQILRDVLAQKDRTNKTLLNSTVVRNSLFKQSPRLVPKKYNPKCAYTFIEPLANDVESTSNNNKNERIKLNKLSKKSTTTKGSQDLRKFFKNAPVLDVEDCEIFQTTATQRLLTENKSRKSIEKIENMFKDLETLNVMPGTQLPHKTSEEKRFRKVNKFLHKTPFISTSERNSTIADSLKSISLSPDAKLFILKLQPNFIKDVFERKEVLNSLKKNFDDEEITKEERDILDLYNTIETVFGGKYKLEEFLKKEVVSFKSEIIDDDNILDDLYIKKFQTSWNNTFQGVTDLGPCCDNSDYIHNAIKKTKRYLMMMEKTNPTSDCYESIVYSNSDQETSLQMNTDLSLQYSKYSRENINNEVKQMPNKSTPIQRIMGTKSKIKNLRNETNRTPLLQILNDVPDDENFSNVSSYKDDVSLSIVEFNESLNATKIDLSKNVIPKKENNTNNEHQDKNCSKLADAHNTYELNIDLNDFLDPFPEEDMQNYKAFTESQKENVIENLQTDGEGQGSIKINGDLSKDLTCEKKLSPKIKFSLSAKLAEKCRDKLKQQHCCLSSSEVSEKEKILLPSSPKSQGTVQSTQQYVKSPSLLDIYMKKVRSRVNIKSEAQSNITARSELLSPQKYASNVHDESVIIHKPNRATKRRVIESESESEETTIVGSDDDDETDFETNASNRFQNKRLFNRREIRKRRLLNSFIDNEAAKSGSDHSEDEMEKTIGAYQKDSIIVSTDDEENDARSTSLMQGIYLKSLKSPKHGTFKIPDFRVYNDQSRIFSQAVISVESSQYLPDSFVVSNEEAGTDLESDQDSICPLEQAEKILKERRRAKRRKLTEVATVQKSKRRRINNILDTSDDEFQ